MSATKLRTGFTVNNGQNGLSIISSFLIELFLFYNHLPCCSTAGGLADTALLSRFSKYCFILLMVSWILG